MRCPKCGVYLEDDRDTCFMCGTKITNNQVTDSTNNNEFSNNSFNSNQETNSFSNNEFSNNEETNFSSDYLAKKKEYENRFNDYKNIKLDDYNDKPDIFDFYNKHKKVIKIILLILSIIIVGLVIFFIIRYKIESKKDKPVLIDLFYTVDDTFNVQEGKNAKQYTKTINGSQCIITINAVKDTSSNHAAQYFIEMKKNIEPNKDNEGNIINPLEEYLDKASKRTINGVTWETLSISYRPDVTSTSFSLLRYKYMSATYGNYSYDIVLTNEKNNQTCTIDLDNFSKSLKFIEKE